MAVIYDVHGNLPALDAVLAEVRAEGIDRVVFGGDLALFGAHPAECAERLRDLGDRLVAVRGNCDRYLLEESDAPEDEVDVLRWTQDALGRELTEWLGELPATAELPDENALVVHASPRSDEDVILPDTDEQEVAEMLAGTKAATILCGHVHIQYRRRLGPRELVNPGSVGLPSDGDPRSAWAVLEDGRIGFRRTAYDVQSVIGELERISHPTAEQTVSRLRRAGP
ncbi:MAG TPA: metallophosphoesterase family protein [Gaiellales bacterium]|jgi:putative phosphoesterase|nr:metallophosphoesterase family protein [Gaiellales bacterium]